MLKISINKMRGFGKYGRAKYVEAAQELELAINSCEFKEKFLSKEIYFEPFYSDCNKFSGNPNGDRQAMYDQIMSGEDLYGTADGDVDIDVTRYYSRWTSAIGYTYRRVPNTWINFKFLRRLFIPRLAGHIIHEYLHNCGYTHPRRYSWARQNSVCYIVSSIIEEIVKNGIKK